MSDYNGWSNWHTWNTNLWLNNDESSYKEARRICRSAFAHSQWVTESAVRKLAESIIPKSEGIDYSQVDWKEIIKDFNED